MGKRKAVSYQRIIIVTCAHTLHILSIIAPMIVNFYIKEEKNLGDESMTITLVREQKKGGRSQIVNSKKLDDFTAIEQQTIRAMMATIEKYSSQTEGATQMGNNI